MYDCAIVGAGPCGVACALYLKQAGYKVVIIENELIGGQPNQTTNISNVVGFIGDGRKFCDILNKQIEENNIEVIYDEAIIKNFDLYVSDKLIDTKTIVIATGASPVSLPEINNAHYCALCDGILYKNKNVIIVGSGNSAFTEALHLSKICNNVTILCSKRFPILANNDLQEKAKNTLNINIINYLDIEENKDNIIYLILDNNEKLSLSYDGIFVCIGRKPNIDWIHDLDKIEVNENYNIVVNDIAITDIFAGGDVINKPIKQISTAINDGVIISQNVIKFLKEHN